MHCAEEAARTGCKLSSDTKEISGLRASDSLTVWIRISILSLFTSCWTTSRSLHCWSSWTLSPPLIICRFLETPWVLEETPLAIPWCPVWPAVALAWTHHNLWDSSLSLRVPQAKVTCNLGCTVAIHTLEGQASPQGRSWLASWISRWGSFDGKLLTNC